MSGLLDRAGRQAQRVAPIQRIDFATVTAFTEASAAYTVSYRGTTVGPVWSENAVRYAVGDVVKVLVERNLLKFIIP